METMTTTDTARAVLIGLETKLAAARQRHDDAQAAAKEIAYEAHVSGGDAQKRLDRQHADAGKAAAEAESLSAAVIEAKARLEQAQAFEAGEAGRAAAVRRFAILESMSARCSRLDAMFAKENAELAALFEEYQQAGIEGERPGSLEWFRVSTKNARLAALQAGPLDIGEKFLAPFQRHTMVETVGSAVTRAMTRAAATINSDKSAKAA
jgi:hypothetical protein